ncbi:MAG: magnesium transporter [Planctomycetota bacterium]
MEQPSPTTEIPATSPPTDYLYALAELHPIDTGRLLALREPGEIRALLDALPQRTAAKVLSGMPPKLAAELILNDQPFDETEAVRWLTLLEPVAASDLLDTLPEADRLKWLELVGRTAADRIADASHYPPNTAGGMMHRQITALTDDLTVEDAIELLRQTPREQVHYLYVVDAKRKLLGVLPLRSLLLGRAQQPIKELVPTTLISVPADAGRDRVIDLFEERRLLSLPVVDERGRLLGVVTSQDAVIESEKAGLETLQKTVGVSAGENALSPVRDVVRFRLPWLGVNLITAFAAAAVVGLFENIIAQVTALAVLLPIVSGQGGNGGAQSLAIIIRGLALREILPGMTKRLIAKEVAAGCINGIVIAIVCAAAVLLWSRSPGLALVIGLAMIVNMTAAALAGTVIPLILEALGKDPAQASSIILTTVTDIIGFAAFLGFAVLFASIL